MQMFSPKTVDAVIKPLQGALTGLEAVAVHQDKQIGKANDRMEIAEASYTETKVVQGNIITTANNEAARARKLAAKIEGLLD